MRAHAVRAVLARAAVVRAAVMRAAVMRMLVRTAPTSEPRQRGGDGVGGIRLRVVHASDFTCDLTYIDIACHTACTCNMTYKGFP